MAKRNVDTGQGPIIAFFQKHPGMVYTSATLANEMGVDEYLHGPIGATMNRLYKQGLLDKIGTGKYLYRNTPKKAEAKSDVVGSLYESIGIRKSTGSVIVKDDDNNLYELKEL